MPLRHLVLSTSGDALKGYEGYLRESHAAADVQLLRFSEQEAMNLEKLRDVLGERREEQVVWILLLATGLSSQLWFDAEHNPKNVELSSWLRSNAVEDIRYVICPTNPTAHGEWPESDVRPLPILRQSFRDFLPVDSGKVSVWRGFKPNFTSTSLVIDLTCAARPPSLRSPVLPISSQAPALPTILGVACAAVGVGAVAVVMFRMWRPRDPSLERSLEILQRLESLELRVEQVANDAKQDRKKNRILAQTFASICRDQWCKMFDNYAEEKTKEISGLLKVLRKQLEPLKAGWN